MVSTEFNKTWMYSCRRAFLLERITEYIIKTWFWMAKYELSIEKKEDVINQIYIKEKIDARLREIRKAIKELYYRKRTISDHAKLHGHRLGILEEEVRTAKQYDFKQLHDFRNSYGLCPFHDDTNPSLVLKNNKVRCFSCDKSWDTIQFVMDKEGLTFPQAVRRLQ